MSIVVGYLPSPEGEAALAAAIEEARRRKTTLYVLNVSSEADITRDPKALDEDATQRLRERLGDAGIEAHVTQLVRGKEPAEELVYSAEKLEAELLVIGIRRRTATGKLLFGSQAQRILLDAECPVLSVKSPR